MNSISSILTQGFATVAVGGVVVGVVGTIGYQAVQARYSVPNTLKVQCFSKPGEKRQLAYSPRDTYEQFYRKVQLTFPESTLEPVSYSYSMGYLGFESTSLVKQQYEYFNQRACNGEVGTIYVK